MQIGRFLVENEVGRGGMGVVYRALDPALDRPVAVKLLAPHLDLDPSILARFHREAAAVGRLKHPHIATVYEFGEHDGRPYIVFEWVEGQTLAQLLEQAGPLPLARALALFNQVGQALDYAHGHGIVHRDVKPANILIGREDRATVVDFGLSWLAAAPSITTPEALLGTPRYMAPEQIRGEAVDGRADLYSLAIVLYEMVAGRPPFDEPNPVTLLHHQLYTPAPPVTEFNPALPLPVERALETALAKDPERRFPTAAAFAQALREPAPAAITTEPALPPAAAPPAAPLARRRRQRRWLVVGLPLLLCLGVLASLGVLFNPALWGLPAPTETLAGESTAVPTETIAEIAPTETLAEEFTPIPTVTLPVSPELSPSPPPPLAPSPPPVSITWPAPGGVWPLAGGDAGHTNFVYEGLPVYHSQPRWFRSLRANSGQGLIVGGGAVFFGVDNETGSALRALEWSTGLRAWDLPLTTTLSSPPALYAAADPALIYLATTNQELMAFSLADLSLVWYHGPETLQGTIYGGAIPAPDGLLYTATDSGWLHALDPLTGELYWSLDLHETDIFGLPPSAGGAAVFLAGVDQTVSAVNSATLAISWTVETIGVPTTAPMVVEAAGQVIVGTNQGWVHAYGMADGAWAWAGLASDDVAGLATDGVQVYATTADGVVYAWDMAGTELWRSSAGSAVSAAPLTDGTSVLVATQNGDILYLEAASGAEVVEWRISLGDPISIAPAPAGYWLFVRGATNVYGVGP
ncbi:MAG: serine/threonine-protein kinase [Chloroflexi bacterium]|nr:serine/threonine-protein kinase [Chloroflexota bacterium]MCI0647817.1 serine/threonine-protein kinase [Chloroflexota bacterium]MCI0725181.1 serine/threonine-protein kinase [Chloroflexota bacterium]